MNHYFQDKGTFKFFEGELKANPLVPRVISGKHYFPFKAIVCSNPKCKDFIDSNLTRWDIADLCALHKGVAIRFELKSTKPPINFFHFDFFNTMDTIQIWGTHSIEWLAVIQELFYENNFGRVGAVVSTFIDELEGDVALSTILTGYYKKNVAIEKMKLQQQADLEEAVSMLRMYDVICVEHKNDAFKEFRSIVDSEIRDAIYVLYGQFSEFTQPIITQTMLRTMENTFRRLLHTQYHCIHSMMGKPIRKDPSKTTPEQEIKECQYNCYTFYTFIQQCCLQNSHNFVWLSLVNAACHFSGWRSQVAKNTMLRWLNDLFTSSEIVIMSMSSLNEFKSFVKAIFDDSQFNIQKKFQQNTTSSNIVEATCWMFLQATFFEYLREIAESWDNHGEIPITYIGQVIPSP